MNPKPNLTSTGGHIDGMPVYRLDGLPVYRLGTTRRDAAPRRRKASNEFEETGRYDPCPTCAPARAAIRKATTSTEG